MASERIHAGRMWKFVAFITINNENSVDHITNEGRGTGAVTGTGTATGTGTVTGRDRGGGTNPPKNLPSPLHDVDPSNTAMPRPPQAPPQPTAPTVETLSHTDAVIARPKFVVKSTPSRGPIPKPHYLPHPWTCPSYDAKRQPDPIHRFSTMHWTQRRTDAQTDRSSTGKFGNYRPLRL